MFISLIKYGLIILFLCIDSLPIHRYLPLLFLCIVYFIFKSPMTVSLYFSANFIIYPYQL